MEIQIVIEYNLHSVVPKLDATAVELEKANSFAEELQLQILIPASTSQRLVGKSGVEWILHSNTPLAAFANDPIERLTKYKLCRA